MATNEIPIKHVRKSVISGSWYPGHRDELSKMLDGFFENAKNENLGGIGALIAPHAGYIYSGQVAAFSFKQIEGDGYNRVIILAPSHQYPLDGASIADYTHYETPLGEVKISSLAKELIKESDLISSTPAAHSREHSAEIEIPFLQKALRDFEIVPIILGRMSESDMDEFSNLIIKHLDEKTLIVASTDLSHYHPYNEAVSMDTSCINSIVNLDMENAKRCEMCGYFPVLITMKIAKKLNWQAKLLKYANSGDVTGDKSGVVGYVAIAFYTTFRKVDVVNFWSDTCHTESRSCHQNEVVGSDDVTEPNGFRHVSEAKPQPHPTDRLIKENPKNGLNEKQKKYLLKLARDTIEFYVREGKKLEPETNDPELRKNKGVFVTLEKNGHLRGCIGHLEPIQPIYLGVRDNAINAAVHDPRFKSLSVDELDKIDIEVSILTTPELIKANSPEEYLENIRAGIDGIAIDYEGIGATYLPQVWEQIPDKEEFLSHLCEKAFLPRNCWKEEGIKIYKYGVIAFKESDFR